MLRRLEGAREPYWIDRLLTYGSYILIYISQLKLINVNFQEFQMDYVGKISLYNETSPQNIIIS